MMPGTHVRKGELLAVMEDPQYIQLQQDYLTANNRLATPLRNTNGRKSSTAAKPPATK